MSAMISEVRYQGRNIVEAMYANKPAWHKLGNIFDVGGDKAPNSEEAMKLAHLGWKVLKEELFLGDGKRAGKFFGLVREDTRNTLNVVKKRYAVLQNTEAFSFLDSLLMDGIMRYEAAFALKGGQEVCLLARMPSVDYVGGTDPMLRYVLLTMGHGSGAINILPTSVRVECANLKALALGIGKKRKVVCSVRHTGDLSEKLTVARQFISQFDAAFTLYKENAQKLLVGCSPEQRREYLARLFPKPERMTPRQRSSYDRKVAGVQEAWAAPAQQVAGVKGTWWAMYNAVTAFLDHGKPGRKTANFEENRFIKTVSGDLADQKDSALAMALEMAV